MEQTFVKLDLPKNGTLIFPVTTELKFSTLLEKLDKESDGSIRKAIKATDFTAKEGVCLDILGGVAPYDRITLIGTGKEAEAHSTELEIQTLGAKLYSHVNGNKVKEAALVIEDGFGGFSQHYLAATIAYGAKLKSYTFDKYFTKKKDEDKPQLTKLSYVLQGFKEAHTKYQSLEAIADGVFFARDFVSEPANELHPESYAEALKELKDLDVKVEVLGEKQLAKLGMGSLLGVGQGSVRESQVVIMQYNGATNKNDKPVSFVGKGVTFDTGGISIKPSAGMGDMKYDMGGSASVVGVMKALAGRKAKVNAVGVVGLVENMPDGNAQRPGDVVKSMSGQTIEVLNTDAEGRLVLADILWYTQDRFKPKFMINLATLTGAIVVALADQYAGVFSNDDELAERIGKAGDSTGEKNWRFPLTKEYDKMIDSKIADMQNISNGRGAGSITAAQFLQRFVNDYPWAHIDIAGMAWANKGKDLSPEGATGYGVRLLERLVSEYYEA